MTPTFPQRHPASWWAEFEEHAERFDRASVTEALADCITPRIPALLLRREAEIAVETVLRHLNRPDSRGLAERAEDATARLVATVNRIAERSTTEARTAEAYAVCRLVQGSWSEAASIIEPVAGSPVLIRAVVEALRLDPFEADLVVHLLEAGQSPAPALLAGQAVGQYSWWPSWMRSVVTERAITGTLDEELIEALRTCAYAELSPAQARMAKRLIEAEKQLVEATAYRLEALGEHPAARRLRRGDLGTVAFAARLIPV